MGTLLYIRLIGFTAGTLLMLFWMVVILGYRRQRNFERVLFFLCLALFLFYSGSLLALNAQIYYSQPPATLEVFSQLLLVIALWAMPALLIHLHIEYANERELVVSRLNRGMWLAAAYLPLVFVVFHTRRAISETPFDFVTPVGTFGLDYKIWLFASLLVCAWWQRRFAKATSAQAQRQFHDWAAVWLALGAFVVLDLQLRVGTVEYAEVGTILALHPIFPFAALVYYVEKHNFLQIGRQRNLVYAVFVTFLALLYLSVIRRVSVWLEPVLPPEATAAILVFVLVAFFEPLQRVVSRLLRATAQSEIDRAHKIMGAILQVARLGDPIKLHGFVQSWVREQLELSEVKLLLVDPNKVVTVGSDALDNSENRFSVRQAGRSFGSLDVKSHGAMLSGETRVALEFLCEQLPTAFDLCRAVEEKVQLERELAERERMAALGQMAASISHNLKNPLGSIKTILQVQIESRELPENFRNESKMVLEEVNRLSSKLNQLLQFSRPAILGQSVETRCEAGEVLREVTEVLRPEADRRGVTLDRHATAEPLPAAIGKEALNDILTNLLVNALDAVSSDGHIRVSASHSDGFCILTVEDDGPGIPPDLQEKILQPFFTTKSQGTGLGLAIVARRVAEAKGHLDCHSPARDARGTRFQVRLPVTTGLV